MITGILWILLSLAVVVEVERLLVVSSAAGLSDGPPGGGQEWLHPVIFEPQNRVQLTGSMCRVAAFLDFAPFVGGFNNLQNCVGDFREDVHGPEYFSLVVYMGADPHASPLLDGWDLATFVRSACCLSAPCACMTRLKIDGFLMEVGCLEDLFDVVFQKFLSAMDHIDCHPAVQNAPASDGSGCSVSFSETGFYATYDRTLDPIEEIFLDRLLIALESMNSTLVDRFGRMGGTACLLGFLDGAFSLIQEVLIKLKRV